MSLTSQLCPLPVRVIAYSPLFWLFPCLLWIVWTMVTTKVKLPDPKVRMELIVVRADETCFCWVRWLATPGVP